MSEIDLYHDACSGSNNSINSYFGVYPKIVKEGFLLSLSLITS